MKRIFPLYLIVFCSYFGFSMIIPILTDILITPDNAHLTSFSFPLRTTILGVLLSTYPLGQFFGGSFVGILSDRIGRKKVLAFSLFIATFCYLGISLSLELMLFSLTFIFLFIGGFSEANILVAQNVITDLIPKEEQAHKVGLIFVFISLGYFLGPLTSAVLSDQNLVSWFGYWTPFILTSLLLFLSGIWVSTKFGETFRNFEFPNEPQRKIFSNVRGLFSNRKLRIFYGINSLLYLSIYGFVRSVPTYIAKKYDPDLMVLSLFVAYIGISMIFSILFALKPLMKKFSPYFITLVSTILIAIMIFMTPLIPSQNSLWVTIFLVSSFIGICLSSCMAMISQEVNAAHQGKVMGINLSLLGGMTALGTLSGNLLIGVWLYLPFLTFGLLALLASVILYFSKIEATQE